MWLDAVRNQSSSALKLKVTEHNFILIAFYSDGLVKGLIRFY